MNYIYIYVLKYQRIKVIQYIYIVKKSQNNYTMEFKFK